MSSANVNPTSVEEVELQIVNPNSSKMKPNSKANGNRTNRDSQVDVAEEDAIVDNDAISQTNDSTCLKEPEEEEITISKGNLLLIFTYHVHVVWVFINDISPVSDYFSACISVDDLDIVEPTMVRDYINTLKYRALSSKEAMNSVVYNMIVEEFGKKHKKLKLSDGILNLKQMPQDVETTSSDYKNAFFTLMVKKGIVQNNFIFMVLRVIAIK